MFDCCFLVDIQFLVRICEKCTILLREDSFFCAILQDKYRPIFNQFAKINIFIFKHIRNSFSGTVPNVFKVEAAGS